MPPLPPKRPRRVWDDPGNRVVLIGGAVTAGLVVLLFLVAVVSAAAPKASTSTVAASGAPAAPVVPTPTVTPSTASPKATTTTAAEYVPTPADFSLEVVETRRSCFGSAGCSITLKLVPTYTGPTPDSSRTYTVLYEIIGGDSGKSGNFTMRGTNVKFSSDDVISTPPNPTLTAQVTRVLG